MANFIIVAASSGIGTATTALLEKTGHHVFKTARDSSKIVPDATLDASDFAATETAFMAAREKLGEIHGVINCAGSLFLKPAHLTSASDYQAVISASLTTAFSVVRASAKIMPSGGSVTLVSSAAALEGLSNHEAIAAAKAGIIGLTLSAAATYAGSGLRVNAVAPGLTDTPMTKQITSNDSTRRVSEAMHALGRLGTAEDIARAIVFLSAPENSWITGQVLAVDGGLSRVRPKMKI
ncbi:MAG TPA: SDR family oxidoreductase [Alphaproteobacteria bacterium]|nr:SDR family oxidoreductase [Alphaproteobacteria bacterium]